MRTIVLSVAPDTQRWAMVARESAAHLLSNTGHCAPRIKIARIRAQEL